jgi:hypothetical protein
MIPARYPGRKQKSGGGVGKKNAPPKWAFLFFENPRTGHAKKNTGQHAHQLN